MVGQYKHPEPPHSIVEAVQYTKSNIKEVLEWGGEHVSPHDTLKIVLVNTQAGTLIAFPDDYICKDNVYGFYPVMRHKFETQYVPVGE